MSRPLAKTGPVPLWAPFAARDFRALYGALSITMIGNWMNNVGFSWLMTLLDPRAFMLGLVQASFTLPGVVLSLPGGVLADTLDRRQLTLVTSVILVIISAGVVAMTAAGAMTPTLVLGSAAAMGAVGAVFSPALQAIIQDMVRREHLIQALTLNSIALNIGRAAGPAIAGAVIATVGVAWTFSVNAMGYGFLAVFAMVWRASAMRQGARESYGQAFANALRFATREPLFRAIMLRCVIYMCNASTLLSLMPLVAKDQLGLGAEGFAGLVTMVGLGAVAVAATRNRTAGLLGPNAQARLSALLVGSATVAMAVAPDLRVASAAALLYGAGWTNGSISYQVAAQMSLPGPMRGRGVSIYLMVFYFGIMFGGVFWGAVADATTLKGALTAAGVLCILLDLACSRLRVVLPTEP